MSETETGRKGHEVGRGGGTIKPSDIKVDKRVNRRTITKLQADVETHVQTIAPVTTPRKRTTEELNAEIEKNKARWKQIEAEREAKKKANQPPPDNPT